MPEQPMPFVIEIPTQEVARIKVVGVGGGGGNALNNMIRQGIKGVEFIAVNTDRQDLDGNLAPAKVQIGRLLTRGLGAGSKPEIGRQAAEESIEELERVLEGADMVFLAAGMGGGTGTGATPIIGGVARRLGILTVAVVTMPYEDEGPARMRKALAGIQALAPQVDTLIVIPNQRLMELAEEREDLTLEQAFLLADQVLYNAVKGIAEVITVRGVINLDFADVRTVLENGGAALIGSSTATGPNRAEEAIYGALRHPMMNGRTIAGARHVLVNITAGTPPLMREIRTILGVLNREAQDVQEILHGVIVDEEVGEQLRVTVLATGFAEPLLEALAAPHTRRPNLAPASAPMAESDRVVESSLPERSSRSTAPDEERAPLSRPLEEPAIDRRRADPKVVRLSSDSGKPSAEQDLGLPTLLRRIMD
ncbi:MAG: cell division protein FtsZ [Bacteroidetes bacterium]|nr:cell division protein FtsZ [Rhodothermia bacterium]MCS7155873.1 cell division protein FtsZ [Bacteroidota bacterium]MCX7906026.1 cell division protein FtsZ [Bacteroidota bacterium]MDW8138154.1 cell division protein FtsZ [Bacteroidota bacterium]MDW8285838.1 cell division protein FtsZ [Bacteroidota bacterium]